MFFCLCYVFSGFLQFNCNFVDGQNNSKSASWLCFFNGLPSTGKDWSPLRGPPTELHGLTTLWTTPRTTWLRTTPRTTRLRTTRTDYPEQTTALKRRPHQTLRKTAAILFHRFPRPSLFSFSPHSSSTINTPPAEATGTETVSPLYF